VSSTSRSGGISLAPVSPGAPVARIAAIFNTAGIPVTTLADYRSMKWSKLLLNQMANGIPAILDWTPGQLYRDPAIFAIERVMLRETLRVIFADGSHLVSLPGFPVPLMKWVLRLPAGIARRLLLRRVERGRGAKLPSLLIDLQAGRRDIEARWLYGAVAETGQSLGIPTPVNQCVFRILEEISTTPDLRHRYQNQPQRLIDAMASS
jgi:ketopantoate reductase